MINLTLEEGVIKRNIKIDNSSEFKDFVLTQENENKKNDIRTLHVENDTTTKHITINGIVLNDIELQLFKEFINQVR